jgi:hypothetical protein
MKIANFTKVKERKAIGPKLDEYGSQLPLRSLDYKKSNFSYDNSKPNES